MDPAPDPAPAFFVIDLQDANKKLYFFLSFSAYFFLKVPGNGAFTSLFKDKKA
jgi:hypothetical protein